jgi:hemerythrin
VYTGSLAQDETKPFARLLSHLARIFSAKPCGTEVAPALETGRQFPAVEEIMSKIVWEERLSVGIQKLDQQHKELIKTINSLIEKENFDDDSEAIAEALDRMTRYADYHFKTEEQLMREHGYPDYASQEREHTEFKTKTANFCIDAIAQKQALPRELLTYLRNWVTHHILETDMKYKAYFKEKGIT